MIGFLFILSCFCFGLYLIEHHNSQYWKNECLNARQQRDSMNDKLMDTLGR